MLVGAALSFQARAFNFRAAAIQRWPDDAVLVPGCATVSPQALDAWLHVVQLRVRQQDEHHSVLACSIHPARGGNWARWRDLANSTLRLHSGMLFLLVIPSLGCAGLHKATKAAADLHNCSLRPFLTLPLLLHARLCSVHLF